MSFANGIVESCVMTQVLIAGGGIGGLSAALACARGGLRVSLFERAEVFSEVGAGIQLGPNAMRVLFGWGLESELMQVVALPQQLQVRSAVSGRVLGELSLGEAANKRYGAPYATVHRADLHGLLVKVLQDQTDAQLHLGAVVQGVQQGDLGVTLQLAGEPAIEGDILVAADGGFSTLRQQLLADGLPQPTGHLAYRAMVLQAELPQTLRSQQVTAWLGPRLHVVQYPVRGGEWLNVVAIVHGKAQGDMAHWDHSANAEDLQHAMSAVCAPLQDLIKAIGHWRLWPLSIRPPMRSAAQQACGRVALLGDAAHPMVPYLAQGAAMAIEDAACLAQVLSKSDASQHPVTQMLQTYASRRWQRNAQVQSRAIRNGEVFHATGLQRFGRDLVMRLLGDRLLDQPWLYAGGPVAV
jgi:salicylate hydroxylase